MMLIQEPLTFRQVLPSGLIIFLLGAALMMVSPHGHWLGKFGWLAIPYGMLSGIAIYGLVYALSSSPWSRTKPVDELLSVLQQLFQNFTWPQIIIVSIIAGVGEELLIRAVLQTFLVSNVGVFWGILLASLVFGLLHFMTKIYVIMTFAIGLLFGLAFHYSGSVVLVILGHTVYDIIAFALIVKFPHVLGLKTLRSNTTIIS